MIENKINIGVVGTGKLGTYHIQKFLKQSECNFVGIYDSNKKLMEDHNRNYHVNIFDSGCIGETYLIGSENEKKNIEIVNMICNYFNTHSMNTDNFDYLSLINFIYI